MTDITDAMGPTWDLAEVLAERTQPKTSVEIFLNEAAAYTKSELVAALADAVEKDVDHIQKAIDEVDETLEKSKYVVKLTGIPKRMREDISSKAMAEFPIKLNGIMDDNQRPRVKLENLLVWKASVEDVINPAGAHRTQWSREQMEQFRESLSERAEVVIDEAIQKLTQAGQEFSAKSSNIDF